MAAEVPAKDVLCEAMEYLSKLGTNLRTRSENLKEKKIRREKLNNVLAVQKAASKVLLICELSKKSLDNVETGVRKVLELIDTSQASSSKGGKYSETEKDVANQSKYYYFEYKTRKLRIKNRISFKHYNSVRVNAKMLPKSMMDKYPVHYNCKLYRMRRKQKESQEANAEVMKDLEEQSIQNDVSIINIPDTPISKSKAENKQEENVKNGNNDISIISIPDSPEPKLDDTDKKNCKSPAEKESRRKSSVDSNKERNASRDCGEQSPRKKSDSSKKHRSREKRRSSDNKEDQRKAKRKRIIRDSSSDDEKKADVGSTSEENVFATKGDDSDVSCHESDSKKPKPNEENNDFMEPAAKENVLATKSDDSDVSCHESDSKKPKPNEENNDFMEPAAKENVLATKSDDSDVSCHESDSKKPKPNEENNDFMEPAAKENVLATKSDDSDVSCHESDSKKPKPNEESNDVMELSEDENIAEKDGDKNDNTVKPVIKCVSLSKLLKPDILQKKKVIGSHSKPKNISNKAKQKSEAMQVKCSEKQGRKEKEDEEYWSQKRKEVSLFVSKKFVINVTRLPELSHDYLNKLCLAKITQDGITICEISNKNVDETDAGQKDEKATVKSKKINKKRFTNDELKSNSRRASSNSSDDHDDALIAEANKVKNSLLNESDSDDLIGSDNELKSSKNTENIKNALLNDSDSETKKSNDGSKSGEQDKADKESVSESEHAKTSLCKSDSESDKNEPKSTAARVEKDGADVSDVETASIRLTYDPSDSDQNKTNSENGATATKTIADRSHTEKDDDSGDKNQNENDSDGSVRKNDENSTKHEHEKTPEKEDTDKAKSSLLNDSSDDKTKTPLSQRLTPQSKKKRMRESIHAKKMLLTYSSSDTEDEQLKDALKDIKKSLLHGSDEENEEKKKLKESSPSSSDEYIIKKVKKKITYDSHPSKAKRSKHKRKKYCRGLDSVDSASNTDNSKPSSSKMVRSKSKPGNSSSQNSDTPDSNDKDIDGLTNWNNLNKPRRRNSNSSKMSESSASFEKAKEKSKPKIKPTGLIGEEMLKAESSSESAEASADENGDDEDIPEITLPSINGSGEHLVKEDLLGESDSSISHNEDVKSVIEESGSEDKPNAKRRKANAISSDSEVGSSRKKDADVKISDFEDSDDSDINNKRSRKKKKATDSDASVGSNSSNEGGKKKRRRIKSVRDSDASGSESETEGRNKHGRKNIRKVMGKNQLEEATKKAARQEKERMARIIERQKMYNNMEFDESGKPDEVVLDKVVLDFDPETKEPLIEVDRGLVKKLKPHQANGIKFMWDACFESVKRIKKDRGSGCILAHCMGLGKTLQVVSLTHTLLTHSDLTKVNRVLVVCPLSTVLNWVNEFRMWLKYAETDYEVEVFELSRYKQNSERAFQLSQWIRHGGVCVLGYEMFRNLSADNLKKFKKKMLKTFQEALVDPGPDMVVCDEGHLLKNEKTSLSQSMNKVKTYRRIVLTGTPLQNNLKEYYCMVQFVKPNLLGKYNEYLNRFVNPITNGQYTDSTEHDIKIMKRRSHVLHKMLDGAVQRRDYGVLAPFLPPKHEYVLFITLSEVQTKLYQHYLDNFSRKPTPGKSSGFLFPDFQSLQRIWTHPLVLKYNSLRYEVMQQKKRDKEEEDEDLDSEGSLRNFIDDDSTSEDSTPDVSSDDSSEVSDDSRKKSKKKKKAAKKAKKGKDKDMEGKGDGGQSRPRRGTRANPVELGEEEEEEIEPNLEVELKNENPTEWWIKLVSDEELDDMRNSHKLVLLFDILRQCETIGDKLLVFSQSLYSLDLIEHFLRKVDDATQEGRIDEKLGGHIGTWAQGVDYFRLDGSTSCENRSFWCKNFNREDNPRARLFLISTRAGGLGINLVAANRVVIFDVSWNPSHDVQSIFRVYRFGQKKPCYVYRFLAMGTMEEKIYERQVTKQAISKRVIDEQQIDRHYAENDLAELYKFEPKPPTPRSIPPLPKDRLFAEMLREHEAQIYKYHEHDSLLENKEEETLSEEERKAAWEDFENEKNKPPPAPFPNTWQMPSLLQQQQLAYAALASMLRKDMPNLSDNQLRDMLPLIYNSNPQLMQKLSEIYKYSPGMMNPAMMNPGVMNPVGGVGALGGASGLQYEPPWLRQQKQQQQQQQQMRLQHMLQHQNQMGAKFYAGGLGSRDPVAMALQQQRAREIMLGNSAGAAAAATRPRGRPPMQPRAPPSGDVVNLDSD